MRSVGRLMLALALGAAALPASAAAQDEARKGNREQGEALYLRYSAVVMARRAEATAWCSCPKFRI